jgi:hypothetical protein
MLKAMLAGFVLAMLLGSGRLAAGNQPVKWAMMYWYHLTMAEQDDQAFGQTHGLL